MRRAQYLIIGSGVAGITAAQEIRRVDSDGRILMVGDEGVASLLPSWEEGEPYYYRAALSEWIAGETTDEMLPGRTPAFYDHMHIERMTARVTRVDSEAKRAHLEDGGTLGYEKLLIATGARANVYPVEGLEDVLVFRSLADAQAIKERVQNCGRALIVGGGVLGLELAGALHKLGIPRIAVAQRTPPIGKPLLDEPAAAWLKERMRADGFDVFVGDTVERVEGQTAHLKSRQTWEFEVFVEAIGITPVFPEVAGLTVGKGIRIDDHCRTSLADIYAAGDCTETKPSGSERWKPTRVWLQCAEQGKVAGRNMAGENEALHTHPFFNASVIYTVPYAYIGEPHGDEGETFVWEKSDDSYGANGYRKIRVVDGELAGALLLGQRHGSMALFKAIGQPVTPFGADIARPDFPWNDLNGQDWDYLFY